MNYYGGKDLASAFQTVRQNTIQIANDIPEEHYSFVAGEGSMTVAKMLTHLAAGTHMAHTMHGVDKKTHMEMADFGTYMGQAAQIEQSLTTKAEIVDALTTRGAAFVAWLASMTDEQLGEHVHLPAGLTPPSKTRFEMLLGAKEHEMHHRAQLMVVQRLLGMVPHLTRNRMAAMAARAAAAQA
jgi:uncharacterized damage-inducible protein DinB